MPTVTLGAPQTTCCVPSPSATVQTFSLSASGCGATAVTSPTTTPLKAGAAPSTPSTSRPAMENCFSRASLSAAGFAQARNHPSLTFILRILSLDP